MKLLLTDRLLSILNAFHDRFPNIDAPARIEENGNLSIDIADIDFFWSEEFTSYLDELVLTLTFEEYMALDFIPIIETVDLSNENRKSKTESIERSLTD
jgi:hypothetical protein